MNSTNLLRSGDEVYPNWRDHVSEPNSPILATLRRLHLAPPDDQHQSSWVAYVDDAGTSLVIIRNFPHAMLEVFVPASEIRWTAFFSKAGRNNPSYARQKHFKQLFPRGV